MKKKASYQESATTKPDLGELREDFLWCVERRDAQVFRRARLNYETRNAIWPNQHPSGRKWSQGDYKAFPWDGAADSRPNLVDHYCNLGVAMLMNVAMRMRTTVSGVEINDEAYANRLTGVLRWLKYNQMKEWFRENTLTASIMMERGTAVQAITWERRKQLGYYELDMEQVKAIAAQAAQGGGELAPLLADLEKIIRTPDMEDEAVTVAEFFFPDVSRNRLRQAIADLRTDGTARFPRAYIRHNRPTVVALVPNEDVFVPQETTNLQEARAIYRRELLTETVLRERIQDGWDKSFVEKVIATQRGRITTDFEGNLTRTTVSLLGRGIIAPDKLYEILHCIRRRHDEEGVPGLYYTCMHPGMTGEKDYAYHALLNYDHGEYPYTLYEREIRGRLVDDARGIGEVSATWQAQIKTEWDSRIDRASIATLPPSHHPVGEAPDRWGPGVQVPTDRPGDYGFFAPPDYDGGSREVEKTVREFADDYFGYSNDPTKGPFMVALRQHTANCWMQAQKQSDTQILQLSQQFMDEQFYYQVVGSSKGRSIRATRDEIQGEFNVMIAFNVDDLDAEKATKKLAALKEALTLDTTGLIDRDAALVIVFELIDPNMGERVLRDPQAASQSEIDDEAGAFAKIFAGIPVDVKQGQAYQLRLGWLNRMIQQNPAAQQRYQSDPAFKENVDRRIKQLQFRYQQQSVNPMIGRMGTAPSDSAV